MTDDIGSLLPRFAVLFALVFGTCSSSAVAEQIQQDRQDNSAADTTEPASRPMGQSLTEFEKMQLHHRRYSTAANNMAHLFKQLNQKIQEVSLAAKTFEAKDNSYNRRQLEIKLQQLENARQAYSVQYSQLQSQMQNEYRNYAAISNDFKARYDAARAGRNREEAAKDASSAKAKSAKNKLSRTKGTKDAKDTRGGHVKAGEPRTEEQPIADSPARDPRILDLDTKEVRARREGTASPASSQLPAGPTGPDGPTLNIIR